MNSYDWNETAKGLAGFVYKFKFLVERGVVPLQVENEAGPSAPDKRRLLFGVFGKDNSHTSHHCEADSVRHELRGDPALRELGFGTSSDGSTWAMLVEADKTEYHTTAGQALRQELLKMFLEEAVQRAGAATATL